MRCPNCGNTNIDQARFCAICGAVLVATKKQPPPFPDQGLYNKSVQTADLMTRPRVITLLAVLQYLASGVMGLGFVGFVFFASKEQNEVFYLVAVGLLIFAVIHFFAGYGLWNLRPYGRTIQLVLAYLGLLSIPIGTIISILVLVYLLKPEVKVLFSGKSSTELQPHEVEQLHKLTKSRSGTGSTAGIAVAIVAGAFVVMMIIGIVSAIAIPNLLNAIQRSKQKRTMTDIRAIAAACEAYGVDHLKYPDAKSILELKPLLVPKYLGTMPEKDAWERQFEYEAWIDNETAEGPTSYMILSLGKDGIADAKTYYEGIVTTSFNNDIVFSNGTFWQYPEYAKP